MKKVWLVRIISFSLSLFLVPVGFAIKLKTQKDNYGNRLRYSYMRSLSDLCDSLANIDIELKKSAYVTTPTQFCNIAAEVYREAGTAMSALSSLPLNETDLSPLFKFVSQVGDYSLTVAKQSISGDSPTNEERENFKKLSQIAEYFSAGVEEMRIRYENGNAMLLEMQENSGQMAESLTDIQDKIDSYPTLIYDGPYSNHILTKESKLLSNAKEVDEQEARQNAAYALGATADALSLSGEETGGIEAYRFSGNDYEISVTKRGGYVVYFRKYEIVGEQTYSYEQALDVAKKWLYDYTQENFETSYYFADEGVLTVNFAYKEGRTVCYTDLIKVGVALSTGEVVLYEANGYLANHTPRTIKTPERTVEEAKTVVSKNLKIESQKQVLIPSPGGMEIHCYEFLCKNSENEEILVYINCDTLMEEQVYMVIKTDGGTLTK